MNREKTSNGTICSSSFIMVIDVINMRSLLNFVHGGRFFLSTHQEFVLGLLVSCTSVCQSKIRLVATRFFFVQFWEAITQVSSVGTF